LGCGHCFYNCSNVLAWHIIKYSFLNLPDGFQKGEVLFGYGSLAFI
jgi:hypothetical protein